MSENSSKNRSLPLVPTRSVTVRATAPYFRPCFPVQWNLKLSVNSVRAWLKVVTHCHFHHVHNLHSVVPLQHAVCQLSVYMPHSLTHHSLTHSLTHTLTHTLTHSHTHTHTHSLTHSSSLRTSLSSTFNKKTLTSSVYKRPSVLKMIYQRYSQSVH